MFFLIDMSNTKDLTLHQVGDSWNSDDEQISFDETTKNLTYSDNDCRRPGSKWLVDVGLQLSLQDCVITWDATRHSDLLAWAAGDFDPLWGKRLLTNKTKFFPDPSAGIDHMGGFRHKTRGCALPSRDSLDMGVKYIQAYDTAKHAIFKADLNKRVYHIHPNVSQAALSSLRSLTANAENVQCATASRE